MKQLFLLICLCLLHAFAGSASYAQDFRRQTHSIMQEAATPEAGIDSLYEFAFLHYQQDYVFFLDIADTLMTLSGKADYSRGKAESRILLSLIADGQGKLDLMRQHIREARTYLPDTRPSAELALILYCEGTYFRRKKRDREAIETFYKGLQVAEAAGARLIEATLNTALGIMYVGRQEYDQALAFYDKTLSIAREAGDKDRIQRCYTNRGIVFMRQQKYTEAIQAHQQALLLAKELDNERAVAFVYNDLGATYLQSGYDLSKAISYLKQSVAIRERLQERNEIAYTYNYLGQAYGKQGDRKEALHWIGKALHVAAAIGNNKQQYEALEEMAVQYSLFRQYDSAYRYLWSYTTFRDSLRKAEQAETIAELTVRYETEKKEQEIALLTQKNRIQQLGIRQRNLYLCIAALLVLGALIVLRQLYRARVRRERQLKLEAARQAEHLQLAARNTLQNDRLRIARDLHDNIGANLTFIQTSIEESAPEHAEWQNIKSLVSDTIAELRRTVWLINKPAVRLDEWLVKLREYYRKLRKVSVQADIADEALILSSRQATLLFRFIQEAINNSLKHSGAGRIVVWIRADSTTMTVSISDDGKGFDPLQVYQGFGLSHMQQSAGELNGDFTLESAVTKGTRVSISFDLQQPTQ